MARSRNIKPGFFVNEDVAELPFETRLLFIGLWTLADREGRLGDRPKRITMALFPGDAVDVDAMLAQLHDAGLICRYQVDGERYIEVVNFGKHQNPHYKEPESTIPPPDDGKSNPGQASGSDTDDGAPSLGQPRDSLANDRSSGPRQARGQPETGPPTKGGQTGLIPDSGFLIPDSGFRDPPDPESRVCAREASGFDEFWRRYPKRVGKGAAEKSWQRLRSEDRTAVLDDLERRPQEDPQWLRDAGQFVPNPTTYLNQRRWEDDWQAMAGPQRFSDVTLQNIRNLEGWVSGDE